LLAVDPLLGFLNLDSNKAAEVRPALQVLAGLAEIHDLAVVASHHLNKTSAGTGLSPLYRLLGSVEFAAVARSIIGITKDRDNDRRVFSPIKTSLCAAPTAHAFELVAGKIRWLGATADTAEDAMDPEAGSALREAVEFLTSILADGPVPAADVSAKAARQGIAERTMRRAKSRLGIETRMIDAVWTVVRK